MNSTTIKEFFQLLPGRLDSDAAEDLDAVDALRASCDALLVGAGTLRADNPRLVLRSEERRKDRVARGLPPDPIKVTITRDGNLDIGASFFCIGSAEKTPASAFMPPTSGHRAHT